MKRTKYEYIRNLSLPATRTCADDNRGSGFSISSKHLYIEELITTASLGQEKTLPASILFHKRKNSVLLFKWCGRKAKSKFLLYCNSFTKKAALRKCSIWSLWNICLWYHFHPNLSLNLKQLLMGLRYIKLFQRGT